MKIIEQKENKINNLDLWIIRSFSLLGFLAGIIMPQKSVVSFVACLMVGIGLGLVISSVIAKNSTEKQ